MVTWNSAGEIDDLLTSLGVHHGSREIVVVDNASSDETCAIVAAHGAVSTLIRLDDNVGFGAANNLGVKHSKGRISVLLNPDTIVIDASLGLLIDRAVQCDALFGPRLLSADLRPTPSASAVPGGVAQWIGSLLPAQVLPDKVRGACFPSHSAASGSVRAGWLTGACIVARRRTLVHLGPFDESIFLYSEDIDLCLRARAQGIASWFCPDAQVVHLGDRSSSQAFSDAGLGLSIQNRRAVVRRSLGLRRELSDFCAQTTYHCTRAVGRTILRRDARYDRAWLCTAFSGPTT